MVVERMIKAVIFDLDNTLYAYDPLDREAIRRVREYVCKECRITDGRFEEAYLYGREETKRLLGDVAASHNRMLYFQHTLEYLRTYSISMSLHMYDLYWGTFLERMKLRDGVREFLDRMHELEIRVMICTDLTAHIQHRKIEALGIARDLYGLVSSEEAGREKPSREIFELCLKKLQLSAGEVFFMGDSMERDVEGAGNAGMQAVWFDPAMPERGQFADFTAMILRGLQ